MLRHWTIRLLVLHGLWTIASFGSAFGTTCAQAVELGPLERQHTSEAIKERRSDGSSKPREQSAPQKAYDLLAKLEQRNGIPIPGYVGGGEFRNREHRLPRGRYREYDINQKVPGRSRGAERLVIEQSTGKAYYTRDHYRTFIPLN